MTTTLADLRNGRDMAYEAKQLHRVPDAPVIDRAEFIVRRCKDKVVLDIGASGPMHEWIVRFAKRCYGIDKPNRSDVLLGPDVFGVDLDEYEASLPKIRDIEVVVCGEVIEHLSNPGWFLDRLRRIYGGTPVIITVPNSFADAGRGSLERGIENCNDDHVSWHSHRTIKTLLNRHGYEIREFYWYGRQGQRPKFSEGLIVVAE